MKDWIKVISGGVAASALLIAVFLIGPVLVLWTINSMAEAGGSSFYIEHELFNYWVAFIMLILVRGGSSSK